MRICVFDSGLGGLSVLSAVAKAFPAGEFIYLGDSARTPYGTKGPETILRYAHECVSFLERYNPDCLIIACNTVSSIALDVIAERVPYPVFGTIGPTVSYVRTIPQTKRILVVGTPATIASGKYQQAFAKALPEAEILARACPLFVPLVESGVIQGTIVSEVCNLYLSDFLGNDVDAVVLGCTHYPFLRDALSEFFGTSIRLIESAEGIVREMRDHFPGIDNELSGSPGHLSIFMTDEISAFDSLALLALPSGQTYSHVDMEERLVRRERPVHSRAREAPNAPFRRTPAK